MPNFSKTKIVATIGPACDSQEMLEKMILTGVSVFRFNMKHNTQQWHSERMGRVSKASLKVGKPVAILMDLQGPEVRIGELEGGEIELKSGEKVHFATHPINHKKTIILNNLSLLKKLKPGQKILLSDGLFEFKVVSEGKNSLLAEVLEGGVLGARKNVALPGVEIDIPTLVEKDFENLSLAARQDVDFIALSFVRSKKDIENLKTILKEKKSNAKIIAKIETQEAIKNFEEILARTDGIMVARGDLGVQLPMEKVPFYQKLIIQRCRDLGKPVITATQMLESMVNNSRPTRAEVNDVANAVYDGTDAIMLSAESAAGKYPLKAVETMVKIASFIEEKETFIQEFFLIEDQTESIVASVNNLINCYLKENPLFKGICAFTETGKTARLMSRLRPEFPIYVFTQLEKVRDQLCLSWGITPFIIKRTKQSFGIPKKEAISFLKEKKLVAKGDKIIMIYGSHWGIPGETNTIRIENI